MVNRVVALSKYGFKLDSLKNDWEKVDKSMLKRDAFNSLEKGDLIEVKERNDKGFILDFVKVNPIDHLISNVTDSIASSFNNGEIHGTDKQREILKGQCLNICFKEINVNYPQFRKMAIDNAKILFREIEDSDYYRW